MTKPTNPNISIPEGFALSGQKADFSAEKLQNGFDPIDPDVLSGDNLNKFIDDTYKGLNYSIEGVKDLYKSVLKYDYNESYSQNSLVFSVDTNDEVHLYRSVINNNLGNSLTDENCWQEIQISIDSSLFVQKSGDTMAGALNINAEDAMLLLAPQNTSKGGTYPSSTIYYGVYFIDDDPNHTSWEAQRFGALENTIKTDGAIQTSMLSYQNTASSTVQGKISVNVAADGTITTYTPTPTAASNDTNIATTKWIKDFAKTSGSNYMTTFSKGSNGYYKFTNGLIIQWGRISSKTGLTAVTFPIAFTSTNYYAKATFYNEANNLGNYWGFANNLSTTGCKFFLGTNSSNVYMWLAIGY